MSITEQDIIKVQLDCLAKDLDLEQKPNENLNHYAKRIHVEMLKREIQASQWMYDLLTK